MPITEPTDAELLHAIGASNDREAFRAFFRRWAGRVHAWALRSHPDAVQADEVVQDVFLRVWRHAARFDPARAAVSTWLWTVARNVRVDRMRRDHPRWLDLDDVVAPTEPEASPAYQVEAAQQSARVRDAVAELPPDQLTVLNLAYWEGRTLSEVATVTGVPLGTVKSRVRLALERLRARVDGE